MSDPTRGGRGDAMTPAIAGDLSVPLGPKGRPMETLAGMAHRHYQAWAVGDGTTTEFALPVTLQREQDLMVFVGGVLLRPASRGTGFDYRVRGLTAGYAGDANRVRFVSAPALNADITFWLVGG